MSTGKYIVVFKDTATPEQIQKYIDNLRDSGGETTNIYQSVLKGFAAKIPDTYLTSLKQDSLLGDSPIDYIEPDGVVSTQAVPSNAASSS